MSELDTSAYFLRAMLLAGSTSPRCERPSRDELSAFIRGVTYGLTHGLNFAWQMMLAAQDIAALTRAHDVQAFLGEALRATQLDGFPLEPILFKDAPNAGGEAQ